MQDLHIAVLPQPGVAGAHRLERVVRVRQRLPAAAVDDGEEVLVEEEHGGDVGVGVHGVDEGAELLLGGGQDHGAAVEQVVVGVAGRGDGGGGAGGLVGGGEGAVLRHPLLAVVRELARVAGAGVRAGDPAGWDRHGHHVVDVLQDHLVAVEEDDALWTCGGVS